MSTAGNIPHPKGIAETLQRAAERQPVSPVGRDRRAFETVPHGYLILDRNFTIVDVNAAYAKLTMTDPALILGRNIFDVFPDNPGDPAADGVRNLTTSLTNVLSGRSPDRMQWQRYDIRDRAGDFIERHWDPTNCPMLDDNGEVEFIVHHVSDVTAVAKRFRQLPRLSL
jgi:PAS domain S-box-containing protein